MQYFKKQDKLCLPTGERDGDLENWIRVLSPQKERERVGEEREDIFILVDKNIQKYTGHGLRSVNSNSNHNNNNNNNRTYICFRERDHKKRTLTRMISPSWKSLRRARTKKKSLLSIETNKVSNSLRAARRVERTGTSPFDPSFFFLSFDKGTKYLNRLADVYHNSLRASRLVVVAAIYGDEPRGEKLLAFLVLSGLYILERLAAVRFRLVRSFAGKRNESKSTIDDDTFLVTRSIVSLRTDRLASALALKKNERVLCPITVLR